MMCGMSLLAGAALGITRLLLDASRSDMAIIRLMSCFKANNAVGTRVSLS